MWRLQEWCPIITDLSTRPGWIDESGAERASRGRSYPQRARMARGRTWTAYGSIRSPCSSRSPGGPGGSFTPGPTPPRPGWSGMLTIAWATLFS